MSRHPTFTFVLYLENSCKSRFVALEHMAAQLYITPSYIGTVLHGTLIRLALTQQLRLPHVKLGVYGT
jgi:hypothetical protein